MTHRIGRPRRPEKPGTWRIALQLCRAVLLLLFCFSLSPATELDDIRAAIKAKGAKWTAKENPISKLPPERRRMLLGAFPPPANAAPIKPVPLHRTARAAAAGSLDWRSYNGQNYVTPVRNQGGCGSCWAFAVTAGLEASTLINEGWPGQNLDLSEQILVSCSGAGNCAGGSPGTASGYLVTPGLPPENYYPYLATNGNCGNAQSGWESAAYTIPGYGGVSRDVESMKSALDTYGPLVSTFHVFEDFWSYYSGVYSYTHGASVGWHAILIVGYDDARQCFIIKNSWGPGWGEYGYFNMAYSEINSQTALGAIGNLAYYLTPGAPAIKSALSASGSVGTYFSYYITASHRPTSFDTLTGLPSGLNINATTGLISGTPTSPGTSVISLVAGNEYGYGYADLSLTITGGTPDVVPVGSHDASDCTATTGWVCDGNNYNLPLTVYVYKDGPMGTGTMVEQLTANITREAGVGSNCGGNTNHGFQSATPASVKDGQSHSIYTYTASIDASGIPSTISQLPGSPRTVNCTPPDTTAPTVPQNLLATPASPSQVDLSWTASSDNSGHVDGYYIYRNGSNIKYVNSPATSFSDTGLAASTAYSYAVAAMDDSFNISEQSPVVSATTPAVPDTTAPTVPYNLIAKAVSHLQVDLSWAASTDDSGTAPGYKVYRNGAQIATIPSTSYQDPQVAASTSYTYRVTAYDATGNESAQSAQSSVTTPAAPDITPPSVPQNLIATPASYSQINLSWAVSEDDSGRVAGYSVYRDSKYLGSTANTHLHDSKELSPLTAYSYTVTAYDASWNESAQSPAVTATTPAIPDTTAPSVPQNLIATPASHSQINLSWENSTDNSGAVSGYKVYRGGSFIAAVPPDPGGNTTSYNNTGLKPKTAYTYAVSAYDASNNVSAKSTAVTAATPPIPDVTPPSTPGYVTPSVVSYSKIKLSWPKCTDNSGSVAGYKIYRDGALFATTPYLTYTNSGLAGRTTYFYKISAYDASNNESGQSPQAQAVTPAAPDTEHPTAPQNLIATPVSYSQVNLSWTPSTDNSGSIEGYKIYRVNNLIATTISNSYQSGGLTANSTYFYKVAAYDASDNASDYSATVWVVTPAVPDLLPPTVPRKLNVLPASPSQLNLYWDPSTDNSGSVEGYKVYRDGALIATTASAEYQDMGRSPATYYSYRVSAYDATNNESARSTAYAVATFAVPDTAAPAAPQSLTASAVSYSQVNLSWAVPSDDSGSIAGYKVYRSGHLIATAASPSYQDTGRSPTTTYNYSVKACDASGNESEYSAEAWVTTPTTADTAAPSAPQNLAASAASYSRIDLSWSASADDSGSVAGYKIYRGGLLIATTIYTSFANIGLSPNTAYSYAVSAFDASNNESTPSAAASASTPAIPDTLAPSISVAVSSSGATVTGYLTVSANAADNTGVTEVEFYVDDGLENSDTLAPYSYLLDSSMFANGPHTLAAKAYDAAGNSAFASAHMTFYNIAADTVNPTVDLEYPYEGAGVIGTTGIRAAAIDDGEVTKVEFMIGGATYTDTAAPFTYPLNTLKLANGPHNITIRAYDLNANYTEIVVALNVMNQTRSDTVLTSTGGAITTPMADIIVPASALASALTITVVDERIDEDALLADRDGKAGLLGITPIASGFRLLPEGFVPAAPVKIKLPLNHSIRVAATMEQTVGIYSWDSTGTTWQLLTSTYNAADDTLNADTAGFSVYRLFSRVPIIRTPAVGEVYVFPNPAKGGAHPVFHIEAESADKVEIRVSDFTGRLIHAKTLEGGPVLLNRNNKFTYAYEYEWNAGNAASGAYFYVVTVNKGGAKTVRKGKFAIIR